MSDDATVELKAGTKWVATLEAAARLQRQRQADIWRDVETVGNAWERWACGDDTDVPRPEDWKASLERFLELGLELAVILRSVERAMTAPAVAPDDKWRYFCGICWNTLRERVAIARDLVAAANEGRPTFTGYRFVRGSHGGTYIRDPYGVDPLPEGYEAPR